MSAWEFYGILDSFNLRTLKPMAFDPQSDQFSQVCFWFAGADNSVDPLQPPPQNVGHSRSRPNFQLQYPLEIWHSYRNHHVSMGKLSIDRPFYIDLHSFVSLIIFNYHIHAISSKIFCLRQQKYAEARAAWHEVHPTRYA